MKNSYENSSFAFVFFHILLAAAASITSYAFFISEAHTNKWMTATIFLTFCYQTKDQISKKHQKDALWISAAALVIASAFVISQVGIYILNIRYTAVVFLAAIAVLAVSELVFFVSEKKKKSAIL